MSELEWEKRALNFQTRVAQSHWGGVIWDTYDVSDKNDLQNEIRRALFADKETINLKDQELVRDITERCMDCSQDENTIRIAVVYICVITMSSKYECIVPIFRVQNCSKNPEDCNIIDHLCNFYKDFENYLRSNTWHDAVIMIPWRARYELDKNGACRVELHRNSRAVEDNILDNVAVAGEPRTSDITLSEEKIFNAIMLMQEAHEVKRAEHINKLSAKHHEKFDAMRISYHENVQPGAGQKTQGDRKFFQHMGSVPDLVKYFENINIAEGGKFNINEQLTIHPRAFVQIPESQRNSLLELTKLYKDNQISKEEYHKKVIVIRGHDKFILEIERTGYEEYLTGMFGVSELKDVSVGDKNIFVDLDLFQIDRLHQVIKQTLNGDTKYIKHGTNFAAKMKAENLTEFCAAAEYFYLNVKTEVQVRRKNNCDPEGRGNLKLKEFYEREIITEIIANDFQDIVQSFQDLINECNAARKNLDPTYRNSFAAANHFYKHKILPKVDPENALSPKTYFEIARDMTSEPWSEVRWTQDGSSLCCTYLCESRRAVAIKFFSLADRTGVIATLMDNNKNRKLEPSRYYYHPDY